MNEGTETRILAIPGSLRAGSWNRRLLEAAAALAPPRTHVELVDLRAMPLFDEDLERDTVGGPEPVRALRAAVAAADAVLFATPEYNHSVPGVLKNAVDWLSRPPDEVLAGKPVAVIGASSGRWGTRLAQAALRQVLYATESAVLPSPALFVAPASQVFDDEGRLVDPATQRQLAAVVAALGRWSVASKAGLLR